MWRKMPNLSNYNRECGTCVLSLPMLWRLERAANYFLMYRSCLRTWYIWYYSNRLTVKHSLQLQQVLRSLRQEEWERRWIPLLATSLFIPHEECLVLIPGGHVLRRNVLVVVLVGMPSNFIAPRGTLPRLFYKIFPHLFDIGKNIYMWLPTGIFQKHNVFHHTS